MHIIQAHALRLSCHISSSSHPIYLVVAGGWWAHCAASQLHDIDSTP